MIKITEMIKLIEIDVIRFNRNLTKSSISIRDKSLLDSAINIPFQTFGDQELFPSIFEKAARLLIGIAKNHPFIDGNKRTAVHAANTFLLINHYFLNCSSSSYLKFVISVVESSLSTKEVASWINHHSVQIKQPLEEFLDLNLKEEQIYEFS